MSETTIAGRDDEIERTVALWHVRRCLDAAENEGLTNDLLTDEEFNTGWGGATGILYALRGRVGPDEFSRILRDEADELDGYMALGGYCGDKGYPVDDVPYPLATWLDDEKRWREPAVQR